MRFHRGVVGTITLFAFLAVGPTAASASGNPPISWIQQFGTSASDFAMSVATDGGDVYVVGSTTGVLTSADGQVQTNANPNQDPKKPTRDAFIRKYDSAGHEGWKREVGTPGNGSATYVPD